MLGGGHGFLQGRYGLIADNLVSARLVLANGTATTVSEEAHSDLFWAIRGAGHNFGIVSEFTSKIYDVPPNNTWAYASLIYTADKVEELYEQINILTKYGTQPVELINYSFFANVPAVDPSNVSIVIQPRQIQLMYPRPL
jgi:hypothetical protein